MGQVVRTDSFINRVLRHGETDVPSQRSNRFLACSNSWYYRTREYDRIGPYASRTEAESAAATYVSHAIEDDTETLHVMVDLHLASLKMQAADSIELSALRRGEWEVPSERTSRICQKRNRWYFFTREGRLVGPYESEESAKESARLFRDFAKVIKSDSILALIETMNENLYIADN